MCTVQALLTYFWKTLFNSIPIYTFLFHLDLSLSPLPTKTLYECEFFPTCAACPAYLILLYLTP